MVSELEKCGKQDAESDPMPFMFDEIDWGVVKASIREAIAGI